MLPWLLCLFLFSIAVTLMGRCNLSLPLTQPSYRKRRRLHICTEKRRVKNRDSTSKQIIWNEQQAKCRGLFCNFMILPICTFVCRHCQKTTRLFFNGWNSRTFSCCLLSCGHNLARYTGTDKGSFSLFRILLNIIYSNQPQSRLYH